MTKRIHNFSAGPATLPLSVVQEAQKNLVSFGDLGMSILEISHRTKPFEAVIQEAADNIRHLYQLPDNYHVFFLQGGATLQFSMVPMNFLHGDHADYLLTGSWGKKAIKEAKKQGAVDLAWDGVETKFTKVPEQKEMQLKSDAAYVHMTSNETIEGVQFHYTPETGTIPLVCDASSDFLSRPLPVNQYGLIYAGAQKNAGPAGVTLVVLRDDLLKKIPDNLPNLLDYRTYVEGKSMTNTPPVFPIYVVMLVTRWLRNEIGGLEKIDAINREKAGWIYDVIDQSPDFYRGHADQKARSLMNVTWRLPNEDLEKQFVQEADAAGLSGLKGHRSVGGLRASIYNAMTREGVQALVDFMHAFQKKHS